MHYPAREFSGMWLFIGCFPGIRFPFGGTPGSVVISQLEGYFIISLLEFIG